MTRCMVVLSLWMSVCATSLGATSSWATSAHDTRMVAPVAQRALARATDEEKKQKKIDKAKKAFDKKLTQTEKKFSKNLHKKKEKDFASAEKTLTKLIDKLKKAGASDDDVAEAEKRRDALVEDVKAKAAAARSEAAKTKMDGIIAKLEKKYAKGLERVDPYDVEKEKKKVTQAIERMRDKEGASDTDVADAEKRRDAFFSTLDSKVGAAKVDDLRGSFEAAPTVAAVAPAETIAAEAPTWCDGVHPSPSFRPRRLELAGGYNGGWTLESMKNLVHFSCVDVDHGPRQAWVQAVRQSISNQYALTNADNAFMMKLAAQKNPGDAPRGDRKDRKRERRGGRKGGGGGDDRPGCAQLQPLTNGTYEVRLTRALERIAVGCGNALNRENREAVPRRFSDKGFPYWVVDIENGFGSELAEAVFVDDVLTDLGSYGEEGRADLRNYVNWIPASAVSLDDARFRKELSAMNLPEVAQMNAILTFRKALGRFARQKAFIDDAAGKNAAVKKMFITGPQAARVAWAKDAKAHRKTFKTVLALEDAMSDTPGGMSGCAEKLFPTFQKWLKGKAKAHKNLSPAELSMDDYLGSQLAYALTVCGRNDETAPVLDQVFNYYFQNGTPQRGPISASYAGSLDAYNASLGAAKSGGFSGERGGAAKGPLPQPGSLPVHPPKLGQSMHGITTTYDPKFLPSAVVKSVKKKGKDTLITFKTTSWKEPVMNCVETNKISRITSDGRILYRMKCKKVCEKTVKHTAEPITIPTYAAGGIVPGTLVVYTVYSNMIKVGRAWPVEVFKSKKRKKRVNLLGTKL